MRRVLGLLAVVTAAWLMVPTAPAQAHYVGTSQVVVSTLQDTTTGATVVTVDVQVPLSNLHVAYDTDLAGDPAAAVRSEADTLRALLFDHVSLATADGTVLPLAVGELAVSTREEHDTLHAVLTAEVPGTMDEATLHWNLVSDVVYSDKAFLAQVASDGSTNLVGVLTHQDPEASLSLLTSPATVPAVGFGTMLRTGFDHFREGIDHQLFLVVLALGATARGGRLRERATRLAALTVCFTVGHSLSLALATLGWVDPPARLVETAIALTIAAAALRAVRPFLGAGAELALTTAFGLVHGFGFAGTLSDLTRDGRDLAVPLLGFNLGLEAAQVAALALFAVPVWLIARAGAATALTVGAVVVVSLSWVAQRALVVANPVDRALTSSVTSPERLALVLLLVGSAAAFVDRRRRDPVLPGHGPGDPGERTGLVTTARDS